MNNGVHVNVGHDSENLESVINIIARMWIPWKRDRDIIYYYINVVRFCYKDVGKDQWIDMDSSEKANLNWHISVISK